MKRNALHTLGAIAVCVLLLGAGPRGPARIGVVGPGEQWQSGVDGLGEGLRALGYVEGRDIQILVEDAKHDKAQVAAITERFKRDRVDVIFTITNTALKVVADLTRNTNPPGPPVVFGSASGPVESGIVPSDARAETLNRADDLVGKRSAR